VQLVDYTTFTALGRELRTEWLPARAEQVYQRDRYTITLGLRTLQKRGWLTISWHPQAARLCLGDAPPRIPDTFTFSDKLRHQLGGLALVEMMAIAPWERVLDLQFARRPGDPILWHLYVEIMGKYSNLILADAQNQIVTAAHQVSSQQSSVRPIQTGQPYELPPALNDPIPNLSESRQRWQERISLIPGRLSKQLLKNYRGLSSSLVNAMILAARLDPNQSTDSLNDQDWQQLFEYWQVWLKVLAGEKEWQPAETETGYTVLGWGAIQPKTTISDLVNTYYNAELDRQDFAQLRHQLSQKLNNILQKLRLKAQTFATRLQQSDGADEYRQQADLLMAHLQDYQPGMKAIALTDFHTNNLVTIPLEPEKNAIQNAQALYKRHQKLKRSRAAVEPLWQQVRAEIDYLEQVELTLAQIDTYRTAPDLQALTEIREELIQQQYLDAPAQRHHPTVDTSTPHRYRTPSGFELLIGRNNRQNDQLAFRTAGDYDLWFHAQEIPGGHGLLRLPPGAVAETADLQFTADLMAFYSRARQSDSVPVVYTEPKHVYKPKGAKPGIAVYKHERILWGRPQHAEKTIGKILNLN